MGPEFQPTQQAAITLLCSYSPFSSLIDDVIETKYDLCMAGGGVHKQPESRTERQEN